MDLRDLNDLGADAPRFAVRSVPGDLPDGIVAIGSGRGETFFGGDGRDNIIVGRGKDNVIDSGARDKIKLGGGADTVFLVDDNRQDKVFNFNKNQDQLAFEGLTQEAFAEIEVLDTAKGVVILFGGERTIVNGPDLDPSDVTEDLIDFDPFDDPNFFEGLPSPL